MLGMLGKRQITITISEQALRELDGVVALHEYNRSWLVDKIVRGWLEANKSAAPAPAEATAQ
jgi:metal-responsive CopG/Arc/MetJ family transcriptional regulator